MAEPDDGGQDELVCYTVKDHNSIGPDVVGDVAVAVEEVRDHNGEGAIFYHLSFFKLEWPIKYGLDEEDSGGDAEAEAEEAAESISHSDVEQVDEELDDGDEGGNDHEDGDGIEDFAEGYFIAAVFVLLLIRHDHILEFVFLKFEERGSYLAFGHGRVGGGGQILLPPIKQISIVNIVGDFVHFYWYDLFN